MSRNRTAALLVTGLLLVGASPATAHADNSPLYRLVDTAAQRLATADPVAAAKWIDGGPITDPARASQVLDAVAADAGAHGVDPQYVRTVFTDQIGATEGLEYSQFGQWKFNPATAPATAPDLSQSRAAIDEFNRTMVEEIARQWDTLHGPKCSADLFSAKNEVSADRRLDAIRVQALSSATRSYCALT
jgi:chorismate mutase